MRITEQRFTLLASLLILIWAVVYQDALISMEAIWRRSDTFAHGYIIGPIVLWLFWRDKSYFLKQTVSTSWLALPFLAGSLFVGLFAYAADIAVLAQLSAITSLISLAWMLLGNQLAWRYKFPLAYLLFLVPMGENLIPWLQDVTAWITVFLLEVHGIPVFRDGLYIQIPSGLFEVAVACSGIRYLIASTAVGVLFGYLSYDKRYKLVLFAMFAVLLPILANGIRAYLIVIIAYYSDMKYATGADHLIYGWVFFGLVIMLMFWIGGKFADPVTANEQQRQPSSSKSSTNRVTVFISLVLFGASYWLYNAIPIAQKPEVASAALVGESLADSESSWGITFNDGLQRSLVKMPNGVEAFRAVYANKQNKGEMISWDNRYHDHDSWTVISSKLVDVNGSAAQLVHLRDLSGKTFSYLYQIKVGDHLTVSSIDAKVMQAWQSISRQSDYAEVRAVAVSNMPDVELAKEVLIQSIPQIEKLRK